MTPSPATSTIRVRSVSGTAQKEPGQDQVVLTPAPSRTRRRVHIADLGVLAASDVLLERTGIRRQARRSVSYVYRLHRPSGSSASVIFHPQLRSVVLYDLHEALLVETPPVDRDTSRQDLPRNTGNQHLTRSQ